MRPVTDTVNGRQQAASRLAVYSVETSGLGPSPGARREPPRSAPHTPSTCPLSPTRACSRVPLPHPSSPSAPVWLSPPPSSPLLLSWLRPGLGHAPLWELWVHLGLLESSPQDGGVVIVTAAGPGLVSPPLSCPLLFPSLLPSLFLPPSLFDLRGSFLEFIVFYCTWWGVGGGAMRRTCPHGVCRYLQKLLPKSCLAACGGASNCSLALGAGTGGRAKGVWATAFCQSQAQRGQIRAPGFLHP